MTCAFPLHPRRRSHGRQGTTGGGVGAGARPKVRAADLVGGGRSARLLGLDGEVRVYFESCVYNHTPSKKHRPGWDQGGGGPRGSSGGGGSGEGKTSGGRARDGRSTTNGGTKASGGNG